MFEWYGSRAIAACKQRLDLSSAWNGNSGGRSKQIALLILTDHWKCGKGREKEGRDEQPIHQIDSCIVNWEEEEPLSPSPSLLPSPFPLPCQSPDMYTPHSSLSLRKQSKRESTLDWESLGSQRGRKNMRSQEGAETEENALQWRSEEVSEGGVSRLRIRWGRLYRPIDRTGLPGGTTSRWKMSTRRIDDGVNWVSQDCYSLGVWRQFDWR